jgi:hypothetical protein
MPQWAYKATPKKVSKGETGLLARSEHFLCRSAFTARDAWISNVRDVRVGDLIHFWYRDEALGLFEVVEPSALPKNGDQFGDAVEGSALRTVTGDKLVAKLQQLPGYEPDPVLGLFSGWPILFIKDRPPTARAKGMNTLVPVR